jgi:hypothetical protein
MSTPDGDRGGLDGDQASNTGGGSQRPLDPSSGNLPDGADSNADTDSV